MLTSAPATALTVASSNQIEAAVLGQQPILSRIIHRQSTLLCWSLTVSMVNKGPIIAVIVVGAAGEWKHNVVAIFSKASSGSLLCRPADWWVNRTLCYQNTGA